MSEPVPSAGTAMPLQPLELHTAPMPLAERVEPLPLRGSLHGALLRLGVLPCATLALVLTGWFTHNRMTNLEAVFTSEGRAIARQVAAMSNLSLYAGDVVALQSVANAAVRSGQATRVEISNSAGIFVAAGSSTASTGALRVFSAPVTLRETSGSAAFAPAGSTAAGVAHIGIAQTFRDTHVYALERTRALMTGVGLALLALLTAWAAVRHMARNIMRPLRRVSQTMAKLQEGQFDARCAVTAQMPRSGRWKGQPHEFAQLAQAINQLAERIQQHHQVNEARVRNATAEALTHMSEAEQSARSRARFLAAAGHDLRQPLHAMGLFIDGLMSSATDTQLPAVRQLQESAASMGVLLDGLLEISRLDAQLLAPALAVLPLPSFFDLLGARHIEHAARRGVRLAWRARALTVHSDPVLLQRILDNLVRNAIDHSPIDGTVLVIARRRANSVCIEVRDNGVGIAPIYHARIFEEFYQIENAERDRRSGFGLGLAICARIATIMHTDIALRSAFARGSTFSIRLPAITPTARHSKQ